jgi:hypothetical protein
LNTEIFDFIFPERRGMIALTANHRWMSAIQFLGRIGTPAAAPTDDAQIRMRI